MELLITGAWNDAVNHISELVSMGHTIWFLQNEKDELSTAYPLSPVTCHLSPLEAEGIICNGIFLYHNIKKFTNLKYIQLTSVGFDRVPMDYVKEHGITINNARGVYSTPMAEYAVAGVLSLYKKQSFFYENQKKHAWEKKRDLMELSEKKVCILGCGSVGTECAKRFEAFDCIVYGIDTKVREHKNFFCIYHLDDVKEVLAKSDIVIITLPLTDETYHIFNRDMFASMKNGAVVVNIARGALIDTKDLIEALDKKLGGAVLDVFEEEPLSDNSPLWDMDNVIITPHNSFVGDGNEKRLNAVIDENLNKS